MKKRKLLTLFPLLLLPLSMTGCSSNKIVIGICQIAEFSALNDATRGFKEAVIEGLGKDNVKFDYQNAAGETSLCSTIMNSFVGDNVDLIMANATPCLQAAVSSTNTIPILATSVTDFGVALSIKDFDGVVGHNISGTSDLAPLDQQADMFTELLPDARKIGLLYCTSEPNSIYQIDTIEPLLKAKGLTTSRLSFSEVNDLEAVLTANVNDLDALFIPTDNTCADNANQIDAICRPAKLPAICGEEGLCKGCGIAALSIDYHKLGQMTGEMAVKILRDGEDISKMAVLRDPAPAKKFNKTICDDLGITIPDSYSEIK